MTVITKSDRLVVEKDTPPRKVFIKTYGCQMNVYDSNRMNDALASVGYAETSDMKDADLVLLNTCHIREKAAEKVYSELGRIRLLKQRRLEEGRPLTLGVTGCVAQAEGVEIIKREPAVDLVAGPQTYHRLPQIVEKARSGNRVVDTEYAVEDKFDYLPKPAKSRTSHRGVSAFLTVQEGCDRFCTFCVVPYTRGSEVSRGARQIIDEARNLCEAGVREITLLGQNVNAWHGHGTDDSEWGLGRLLHALSAIEGLARLRYVTSHPRDMKEELITAHRDLDILMPYLHLPVQCGSDRVLKAMNRRHRAKDYLELVEQIRRARPDIALSGDFIVGFPGESDADFEATLELVRQVNYAQAYSFKYSPRPGTPGAELEEQLPEAVKSARLARLQTLLNTQQLAFNHSHIGSRMEILLEKRGRDENQLIGRSPWLQSVIIDASAGNIGDIVEVRIADAGPNSLVGDVI